MIDTALDAEERELLRSFGEEPDFFVRAFGLFGGKDGWVHILLMLIQGLLFVAGVIAAWKFFEASDPLTAMRFGIPAAVLLLGSLIIKIGMWPTLQANRVIREVKRLELRLTQQARLP
ncbi:MAG: DUF6768 family protein [Sphingomicrobium sp.]